MNHTWQHEHNKIQLTIQYNHQTLLWIWSMRGWAYQRLAIFKLNFFLNECARSEMWKSLLQTYLEHMILKKVICQCQDFVTFEEKKANWVKLTEHLKSWFIWIHSVLLLDLLRFDSHFEHFQFNLGIGQLHKGFNSIQLKIIESNLKLNPGWIGSVHLWQDVSPGDDGDGFLLYSGVVSTWGKGKQHSTKLSKVCANK